MKTSIRRFYLSSPNFKFLGKSHTSIHHHHHHSLNPRRSPSEPNASDSTYNSVLSTDAHQLFAKTPQCQWDVVSATAAIGRHTRQNRHKDAINLFSKMLDSNIKPNEFTFATLILSSNSLKSLNLGKQLHASSTKFGLSSNVFVGSSLLDHYCKSSTIEEAQRAFEDTRDPNVVSYTTLICGYLKKERFDAAEELFKTMPEKNVVSWNAMIGGYSQTGRNEEAVNLFIEMLREGLLPNGSTLPCVISAAANIAAMGMGKSFHCCSIKFLGGDSGIFVGNSLISFYAKCGNMEDSLLVFSRLPLKNIVSWNALICGYSQNGNGKEAIDFFEEMAKTGLKPNSVTFLGLLQACNHVGLVDEGYSYFNNIRIHDPEKLKAEHYACMVDLFARSGRFLEAERFIRDLPFDPGIGFWKALLGGCRIHSNVELGKLAVQKIEGLDPGDVSSYVMVSNAYSASGRWQRVAEIRAEMRERGMKRVAGCSWIEVGGKICVFVTGDRSHKEKDEIYLVLKIFMKHSLEKQEYGP